MKLYIIMIRGGEEAGIVAAAEVENNISRGLYCNRGSRGVGWDKGE